MPYEFRFVDDPHISMVTFTGKVTQQDLEEETEMAVQALHRCTGMYYMIADLTQKPVFTFNLLKLSKAMDVIKDEHFGWAIVVGTNPLGNFWLEMLSRLVKIKFKVFETHEEAFGFIDGMRKLEHPV